MALTTNNPKYSITSDDTFPLSSAATGTITSVNNKEKIVGVGTLFTTEFSVGDWIYINGNNEIRRIVNIVNNLECTIDAPFDTDAAGDTFKKTPKSIYSEISAYVVSGVTTIDGITFAVGRGTDDYRTADGSFRKTYVDPIVIVTAGEVAISALIN